MEDVLNPRVSEGDQEEGEGVHGGDWKVPGCDEREYGSVESSRHWLADKNAHVGMLVKSPSSKNGNPVIKLKISFLRLKSQISNLPFNTSKRTFVFVIH